MTEEIIIDGVDVSGCVKQGETVAGITCGIGERIRLANEIITKHKLCKDSPNCYFKQLKRKEQECEELKKQIEVIKERLFSKIAPIDYTDCPYYIKMVKLKQTLTEIKEIAESYTTCKMDWYFGFKNIIQKISEVVE